MQRKSSVVSGSWGTLSGKLVSDLSPWSISLGLPLTSRDWVISTFPLKVILLQKWSASFCFWWCLLNPDPHSGMGDTSHLCVYSRRCRSTWVCTDTCLSMHLEVRVNLGYLSSGAIHLVLRHDISVAWCLTNKVSWLATEPWGPPWLSACHLNRHFWCGFWGLNSGPHTYTASSLSTEVSFPFVLLSWFVFKFCFQVNWDVDEDAQHQSIFWEGELRP